MNIFIPAQDLVVRILRNKTTMLSRWVRSPANLNRFMILLRLATNLKSLFPFVPCIVLLLACSSLPCWFCFCFSRKCYQTFKPNISVFFPVGLKLTACIARSVSIDFRRVFAKKRKKNIHVLCLIFIPVSVILRFEC